MPTPRRRSGPQRQYPGTSAGRAFHAPKARCCFAPRQINKLIGAVEREGMTLVPLKLYFNEKGRAKIELALARGTKLHDKRETEKKRIRARARKVAPGEGLTDASSS
jgi:hypothetical protein